MRALQRVPAFFRPIGAFIPRRSRRFQLPRVKLTSVEQGLTHHIHTRLRHNFGNTKQGHTMVPPVQGLPEPKKRRHGQRGGDSKKRKGRTCVHCRELNRTQTQQEECAGRLSNKPKRGAVYFCRDDPGPGGSPDDST